MDRNLSYWERHRYREAEVERLFEEEGNGRMLLWLTFSEKDQIRIQFRGEIPKKYLGPITDFLTFANEARRFPHGSLLLTLHDSISGSLSDSVPVLAFCRSTADNRTVLLPDPYYLASWGYYDSFHSLDRGHDSLPWERKAKTCFWRGASTGFPTPEGEAWADNPRVRLCMFARSVANTEILDFALSQIVQCNDPAARQNILTHGLFQQIVPIEQFAWYRHNVEIDGNASSWGFFQKLYLQTVVLKIDSPYEQWFSHMLSPGKHYLPVTADLGNLLQTLDWAVGHEDECREVAREAYEFAKHWTYVETVKYFADLICRLLECQER